MGDSKRETFRRKSPLYADIRSARSVAAEGQESEVTSTLDSDCQATLMMCTSSRNSSGEDLASFRNKTAKLGNILVIDVIRFVNAEAAYFSAALATTTAIISLRSVCHCESLLILVVVGSSERQVVVPDDLLEISAVTT